MLKECTKKDAKDFSIYVVSFLLFPSLTILIVSKISNAANEEIFSCMV